MLENNRPHMEAAKITPAAVMTPPVDDNVRMIPNRVLCGDSSRNRDAKSRL
jgi:hypothetical protein